MRVDMDFEFRAGHQGQIKQRCQDSSEPGKIRRYDKLKGFFCYCKCKGTFEKQCHI